jgi:hypothetical protein
MNTTTGTGLFGGMVNHRSNRIAPLAAALLFTLLLCGRAPAQLYVQTGSGVSEYNLDGSTVNASLITIPGFSDPSAIALDGSDLLVGNLSNGLSEYTLSGSPVSVPLVPFDSYGQGAVLKVGSTIYTTDSAPNEATYAPDPFVGSIGTIANGAETDFYIYGIANGIDAPISLAASGSNLFVLNYGSGSVGEYNTSAPTSGGSLTSAGIINSSLIASAGTRVISIALSGSDLYVLSDGSSSLNGQINEYTLGSTPGTIASSQIGLITGLQDPTGFAVSGSDIYVANAAVGVNGKTYNSDIGEYTTSGATINASLIKLGTSVGSSQTGGIVLIPQTAPAPAPTPQSVQSTVSAGVAYSSSVAPVTSTGGLGSTVSLVGGVASGTETVTLSTTAKGANFRNLASDVVSVSGNAGSVFAVQLTFDLTTAEKLPGGPSAMTLLWDSPSSGWVNAVYGNTGSNTSNADYLDFQGSFAAFEAANHIIDGSDLTAYLGAYGVDTTDNTVWAVINHNSDFGVGNPLDAPSAVATPEPSTWALLLLSAAGMFTWGRRRSRSKLAA